MEKDRPDSELAALGINRHKILQYLGLFCLLAVMHSIYLKGILDGPANGELTWWSIGRFCAISALPFGVLACSDGSWRSCDAVPVSAVAWIAVYACFSLKHPDGCPWTIFLLFIPLIFCAQLGHTVGALFQHEDAAD
jgi:hypothetical protein